MSANSFENLTLREKLREADLVLRDFADHIDRSLIPKAHDLRRLAKEGQDPDSPLEDVTLRNHADQLLRSERYATELYTKVNGVFSSILGEVQEIIDG